MRNTAQEFTWLSLTANAGSKVFTLLACSVDVSLQACSLSYVPLIYEAFAMRYIVESVVLIFSFCNFLITTSILVGWLVY